MKEEHKTKEQLISELVELRQRVAELGAADTERKRAEQFLQALNQAALAMEQALVPGEIFAAVAEEFKKLGLFCVVLLTDESQKRLFPKYLSYEAGTIKVAEKLTGLKVEDVSILIETADISREVIWEKKTIFMKNAEGFIRQLLPDPAKRFTRQIVSMLKVPKSVAAPLMVEDEVIGVFAVQSDDLTENDMPTITAFAHQMAAVWRKAKLMQDLERSLAERKRAEEALRSLAKATVGVTGQECFDRIVSELCKYFAANCGIVGQIIDIDKETVRALSMELDGEKVRDYEYWLQGTPCENVVEKGPCLFPQGVCDLFPDDRDLVDMKAKGYVGAPIRDRSGNVLGILCAISRHSIEEKREWRDVIDIMAARAAAEIERKQAEEALRESEERYRRLVELSPDTIAIHSQGKIVFMNSAGARLLGAANPEQLIGKPVMDLLHPDYRDMVKERVRRVTEEGEEASLTEEKFIRLNGTVIDVEVAAIPFTYQGKPAVQAVVRDITERKRAEEALQESEEKYRLLVENANEVILVAQDVMLRFVNPKATEITGYSREELTSRPFVEFIHPDDREMVAGRYQARLKGEVLPAVYSFRIIDKEGNIKWLEINAVLITWEGKPATLNFLSDITGRKRAEEALRVSEERFALAVQGSDAGLWDWDIQNNSLYWSPRLKELLGYADDELDVDFETFESLLHPDDREHTGAAIEAHLKDRGLYEVEQRLRAKSGEYRWFRARGQALWDEAGNPLRMVGSTTDITERKRAEESLRKQREELQLILDTVPATIWFKDKHNRILRINKAAAESMDMLVEDIEGKTAYELFHEEAEHYYQDDLEVMNSGKPKLGIVEQMQIPSGEKRWVRTDKAPYYDERGNVAGVVAFVVDITERVRAEDTLQEYAEHLEEMVDERTKELRDAQEQLVRRERLAVLGQLAGGVGHELRNPLGVISNAVYYLQMVLPDVDETTADAREYLDIISEEVRNSTKIISDLLDFSRTRMPDREKIAVSELVAVVLEKRPPPENVEATTQIAPDLPPVFVDPQQMGQVLGNLVTNAYQAMKEGGNLTISAQAEEGQVTLSVADTGCGISPEHKAKLFEPLFTTKARGIGLGLAVSRILVEANGGSIEVASEVGKGSTFTVRLPIREGVA